MIYLHKISLLVLFIFLFSFGNLISQENIKTDTKKILELIEKFGDKNPWANGDAINELVNIGEPAVNYLINALQDKNPNVRWCSALALGKYKSNASSAIAGLQNLLNDEDADVRWAAYVSISKISKDALNIVPEYSDVINTIENLTPELIEELKVPGVSISIIKNKELAWSKSFGVVDTDSKIPVNDKTIFEACSMSKPVFAYLVLKLVDERKLDLDEPLYKYLQEEFVCDNEDYPKQITARMILSHTSGLPNWRKGDEERNPPLPIYFKPGTKFNYSGEGIYYLQRVIEHIVNEPLESYAKRTLFDKLNLNSTSYVWTAELDKQIATGHNAVGKCNERKKYLHSNAAYTLYTTSNEYAKLIIEIMKDGNKNDYSVSDSMIKEMLSHQVRVDTREVTDRPGRYLGLQGFRGLGWAIDSSITGDVVYHSGANQTGFRCYSQFSIKNESGIVIMINGENGSELWQKLIRVIGDL